jgi:hypothetical protein
MSAARKPWFLMLIAGAASTLCYAALFTHESEVMKAFTRTDGWYPALPVLTAFLFSLVHGAFTGYFWEVMGVVARPASKEVASQEIEE